ncbi:glycosyltransferase family 4 protein [uncultured Parabacteroides sp.]|uniref:glycosyltransferase family 4 protein n=1 Tax=uncultured Parabacteroides sp. TaxID=512312 RepID=UPI00263267DB|nr:glycosyltransferase family 4 protein [uncultured Parabacteroides sp.]
MRKIIRISTVPLSLDLFCRGLLRELSETYEVIALSSPGEELEAIARREGVRTVSVPMKRQIAPWHDLLSLVRLIWVFKKESPMLVHSITPKAGLLSMLAARIAGVPVRVHTFTGLLFPTAYGWQRRLLMLADRITCICSTHVLAEGEGVKKDLAGHGITRKNIGILGNGNVRGIDLQWYSRTPEVMAMTDVIRKRLNIRERQFTFVFVGRLVREKGIKELVEAFCGLQAVHPEIHLILVGEGKGEDDLFVRTIRDRITATGHIHIVEWQTDVRPWYVVADALVFPSFREGFPNVVIEAGALELPSIVTDINGSREIIREGENGMIVPARDSEALYNAMEWMIGHPSEVRRYGANARPLIASRYEQKYVWLCLKEFYKEILR